LPEVQQGNASGRQLLRNFFTSYVDFAVALVLGLLFARIALHRLGPATYGLWAVLGAIAGYLSLLDAGVSTAVVGRVASCIAREDHEELADVVGTAGVFFVASGAVAVGLSGLLVPFIATLLRLGSVAPAAQIALLVLGARTGVNLVGLRAKSALFGSGRGDWISMVGVATALVTRTAQIAVLLLGGGLVGLAVVTAVGGLVGVVWTTVVARRLPWHHTWRWFRGFSASMLGQLLRAGGRNALVAVSGTVSYGLDSLIIGLMLPVSQVAPYNLATSTAGFTRNLSTYGTNQLFPTYAHADALGDNERQFQLFSRAVLGSMAVTIPLAAALIGFGQPILHLWLGAVPPRTFDVVVALNIVFAFQLPGHQSFVFLTGIGRTELLLRFALVATVVNLVGTVFATRYLGPVGPAIGSLPQVVVTDFAILPVVVCRFLRTPVRRYLREVMAPLALVTLLAAATVVVLRGLVPGHSMPAAAGKAVGVAAVSWVVLVVALLRTDEVFRTRARAVVRQAASRAKALTRR
jgi:O-antigen/teichoic acid export membrane protein